ncbi:MAG: transglycosylase SLT domain-containing protein [Bacteroidales bacterium]|nr:transglycosylase SLT domain-containing protein [Bacteroidales bacterium]
MTIRKSILVLQFVLILSSAKVFAYTENKPGISASTNVETAYIDSTIILDSIYTSPNEAFDDIFSEKFDSLMNDWYIRTAYNIDSTRVPSSLDQDPHLSQECFSVESPFGTIPDSVFIQRLQALNSMIDLTYNESVKKMIEFYSVKIRKKVEIIIGLANYYFPMFEETLDKYNLPVELKYMAIIESALNAKAYSRAGASGLWQFMYGTGKKYGLEVNSYVDQRRDPIKSTEAAARYLSDLYNIYQDWHLVIAAYNCGPGNINKAIARSGGKRDYWSIYYRLPRETRGYVPAFISAAYIMNYYKHHNLSVSTPSFQLHSDSVLVTEFINLKQVSEALNISMEELRELNPMYKKDIIPAQKNKPYPLVLPIEQITKFIEKEKDIIAHNRQHYFPDNRLKEPEAITTSSSKSSNVPNIKGKTKVSYTVKTGETIGQIAEWFNAKVSDIKYWNNIRGNIIRAEQKLTIYVPTGSVDDYRDLETMTFEEKQRFIGKTKITNIVAQEETETDFIIHTVKNGDNLWEIAKKYSGVSADDIKRLNNITNTRGLYIGQKLKIMKKS